MTDKTCELGMVGLGVMGRNLLLNMADHGFSVAGYDTDLSKLALLRQESSSHPVFGARSVSELIGSLTKPRVVMLLVPAGEPVDSAISELLPYLEAGDIIIDGGNSYYKDTEVRSQNLARKGLQFLGVGISGGEEGARKGPSIMPGGPKDAYERVRRLFEACSAHVADEPCVAYLGPKSAGHFVKMVHNGIEYGLMQLISETYDLLKRALSLNNDELQQVYSDWQTGDLNSYLVEITGNIFEKKDETTGKWLIDEILDVARQLGTGMWTSQSAMELQVPVPIITMAVDIRNLSMLEAERSKASVVLHQSIDPFQGDRKTLIENLRRALFAAMLMTYAQGMAVLQAASKKFKYDLDLETVARIWRGGCIIRAELLETIRRAYQSQPLLPNLLLDEQIAREILTHELDLRNVVKAAADTGVPAPCFMASLSYLDGYRSAWLPANLIQAQRDYFGAHTYERNDEKGTFHTHWEESRIYEKT